MYLIPKKIKNKSDIFLGFGFTEVIIILICFLVGLCLSSLVTSQNIKLFLFAILPMIAFILLFPLPNNVTFGNTIKKFLIFSIKQKKFKKYGIPDKSPYPICPIRRSNDIMLFQCL